MSMTLSVLVYLESFLLLNFYLKALRRRKVEDRKKETEEEERMIVVYLVCKIFVLYCFREHCSVS